MGAVPVFKGGQKDMPFLPLIWVSYGMAPTNSTYLGSGTNRGLYAAPGLPDALVPMLNADGDMPALFLGDPHLPWGNAAPFFMGRAIDQDNPPRWGAEDMGTRLVSWSPTNLVLETVGTTNNYAAGCGGWGFAVESTTNLARPRWLDVAMTGVINSPTSLLPIGSTYQFSVTLPPGQTTRFFRIRNCNYGVPCGDPEFTSGFRYLVPTPPTNFATRTSVRPTNTLHKRYAGPGPVVAAAQPLSFQPKVPLPQALASVEYSPDEAQAALATISAKSAFVAPDPAADGGDVSMDHEGRVVLWRSKATPTTTAKASLKSVSPAQLKASDPAGFYAPQASADRFIAQFGSLFGGTKPQSGFRAQSAERDGLGMTHVRYRQYLEGLPVFGAEVVVHVDAAGKVTTANGLAAQDPGVSVSPTADLAHARETALGLWRRQPGSLSGGKVVLEELEVFCPRLFLCDSTPEFSATNVLDAADRPNPPEPDAALEKPTGWVNSRPPDIPLVFQCVGCVA